MKEVYLQMKMAELSEQMNKVTGDLLNTRLQLQQISKGIEDYHILLDKLHDVKQFRMQLAEELSSQNQQRLSDIHNSLAKDIDILANRFFDARFGDIEKMVNRVSGTTEKMKDVPQFMHDTHIKVNSILAYNYILGLALIHKDILTPEEVKRCHKLSRKAVKKLLNGGDNRLSHIVRVKNDVHGRAGRRNRG